MRSLSAAIALAAVAIGGPASASCLQPDENELATHHCYTNGYGADVHSPSYDAYGPPVGATAQCADGTWSFSQHSRGTCSHHGGER
jgi:Protein of unknown function (DUF3761)